RFTRVAKATGSPGIASCRRVSTLNLARLAGRKLASAGRSCMTLSFRNAAASNGEAFFRYERSRLFAGPERAREARPGARPDRKRDRRRFVRREQPGAPGVLRHD